MRVVIAAANSHLGRILSQSLGPNHQLTLISRRQFQSPFPQVQWDGASKGDWVDSIDGADVLINLAGRSVNCRYNSNNRKEILESRVISTRAIGNAIQVAKKPPAVWLQMSTATIYSHCFGTPNDDIDGIISGSANDQSSVPDKWNFSIKVAKSWEAEAKKLVPANTRLVLMRSAVVMTPNPEGVFEILLRLVRFGMGGKQGNGRQFVSWIHDRDFSRAIDWLIQHDELAGPINLSSPNPVPNATLMANLRKAWGARIGLAATKWMLEIGAFLMRTETELILKSRKVVPTRLLESGFEFEFPDWTKAAIDLCHRWCALRHHTVNE